MAVGTCPNSQHGRDCLCRNPFPYPDLPDRLYAVLTRDTLSSVIPAESIDILILLPLQEALLATEPERFLAVSGKAFPWPDIKDRFVDRLAADGAGSEIIILLHFTS